MIERVYMLILRKSCLSDIFDRKLPDKVGKRLKTTDIH